MSTSLLYHALGIRGYRHMRTGYVGGRVIFTIEQEPGELQCPGCGSRRVIRRGKTMRTFKGVPIGSRPVAIVLGVQRVECKDCAVVRQVRVRFAEQRRTYTKRFERYALELCRFMTIQDVARHLQVGWDVIKDMHKRYLRWRFRRPKLKWLEQIAIDEISIGRGHRYLTVVLDLASGAVVFVGEGKGARALLPFWKRLRRSRAEIAAVATDMSPAYISAVLEKLPQATLVFDRFHVIKLFNDKLSELRRRVQRGAEGLHKQVLKGTRWLLLKNPQNLHDSRNERERLQEALRLNQPLATAYYLKEDLREFWEQADKASAERFLDDWIARAEASEIGILKDFAKTLRVHRFGLVAWYDYPISTGPLEGTNNKIKTIQRRAYGFRDRQYFTWRIYGLHETKYALVG